MRVRRRVSHVDDAEDYSVRIRISPRFAPCKSLLSSRERANGGLGASPGISPGSMSPIDLHAHTNRSDGTLTPAALVGLAARKGLRAVAVVDHDTTSGLEEALEAGRREGVEVIVGCEISTRADTRSVHILAYAFDPEDEALQALLERGREARRRRNRAMLARMRDLGFVLTEEEIEGHAEGCIVARPHFALAMIERGYVEGFREAYARWIGEDCPAYVVAEHADPEHAVRTVRTAGGVTSIAHPGKLRLGDRDAYLRLFQRLASAGLSGIEVDHPSHSDEEKRMFRGLAEALDLVPTGGSDFHGGNKPNIGLGEGDGSLDVPYETWERLLARRLPS